MRATGSERDPKIGEPSGQLKPFEGEDEGARSAERAELIVRRRDQERE